MINHFQKSRTGRAGRHAGQQAFSLIEIMIAIVVTAIIFSALHFGISTGFVLVQASREQLRANQICISRMEGIRLCNWDTQLFSNSIVPTSFVDYYYPVGLGYQTNGVIYYGTMSFSNVTLSPSPSYGANMRLATVTVTWTNSGQGQPVQHTERMQTYVSHYGIQNYVYTH